MISMDSIQCFEGVFDNVSKKCFISCWFGCAISFSGCDFVLYLHVIQTWLFKFLLYFCTADVKYISETSQYWTLLCGGDSQYASSCVGFLISQSWNAASTENMLQYVSMLLLILPASANLAIQLQSAEHISPSLSTIFQHFSEGLEIAW